MNFVEDVLYHIPRATKKEKESIRTELENHLLDHQEALTEKGVASEEARRKAEEAMGDPAEVGQALNAQLSPFWLVMERSAWLFLVTGLLVLVLALSPVVHLVQSAGVRTVPGALFDFWLVRQYEDESPESQGYPLREDVDLRMTLGSQELRVCRLYMDPTPGEARMAVLMVLYNRDLMGYVSNDFNYVGFPEWRDRRYIYGNEMMKMYLLYDIPVSPGDPHITLTHQRFGEKRTLAIPIPWEVTP